MNAGTNKTPVHELTGLRTPMTLHQAAVSELREAIILGKLKPGTLLKDAEIASRMGLSNTPIREAFVKLASEGLVEITPNKYKRVAPIDYQAMVELLMVQSRLWESGYEWGSANIGPEELARLKNANDSQREAAHKSDAQAAVVAAHEFHLILMEASGNRELVRVSVDRVPLIQRFVILCMPSMPSDEMLSLHEKMYLALEHGETTMAMNYFRQTCDALLNATVELRDSKA